MIVHHIYRTPLLTITYQTLSGFHHNYCSLAREHTTSRDLMQRQEQ